MVDYAFYVDTYHGASIPEKDWPYFEARATDQLARYKRTYTVTAPEADSESKAVCAMADALAYFEAAQSGGGGQVASASIGSVSTSYAGTSGVDLSPKGQAKELYHCAGMYLEIYRGVV